MSTFLWLATFPHLWVKVTFPADHMEEMLRRGMESLKLLARMGNNTFPLLERGNYEISDATGDFMKKVPTATCALRDR